MFAVGNILISDDLLDAPFSCNLGACHGACCVVGDAGAPLEPDERALLEEVLPVVRERLRPEALAVIEAKGVWEELDPGEYATTCVGDAECVFVVYDGPVAKCAIQAAQMEGRTDIAKPISCHLFPVRIERIGDFHVVNYERVGICRPGVRHGRAKGTQLAAYLKEPLERRFGDGWYKEFVEALEARRASFDALPAAPRHSPSP